MADVETMRGALDDYQARVAESLVRALTGTFQRHCGIAVAVDDQGRHGDRLEISTEVSGGPGVHGAQRRVRVC